MDLSVFCNTIAMPDRRQVVECAVLQGIGQAPGNWVISIFEPQRSPEYIVSIERPDGFAWKRAFFGPVEQTPEFIQTEVARAVREKA